MAVLAGQKMKVLLETEDGTVTDLTGYTNQISYTQFHEGLFELSLNVVGHDARTFLNDEWDRHVSAMRSAHEWGCPYCGTVNPRAAKFCGEHSGGPHKTVGCNAARPFLYD